MEPSAAQQGLLQCMEPPCIERLRRIPMESTLRSTTLPRKLPLAPTQSTHSQARQMGAASILNGTGGASTSAVAFAGGGFSSFSTAFLVASTTFLLLTRPQRHDWSIPPKILRNNHSPESLAAGMPLNCTSLNNSRATSPPNDPSSASRSRCSGPVVPRKTATTMRRASTEAMTARAGQRKGSLAAAQQQGKQQVQHNQQQPQQIKLPK
mmetsp:Transcript_68503/g.196500  ORF Transcript_68503/g.196500 Transcript_68503/m.196500 type:complete len:209 (+) Transcript_68503:252-878(+)